MTESRSTAVIPPIRVHPISVTAAVIALSVALTAAHLLGVGWVASLGEDGRLRQGHLWQLVTSTWVHGSIIHIAFNLMWLAALGPLIERKLGGAQFSLLYLTLAVSSGGFAFATEGSGYGLSGVVYGLYGFALTARRRDEDYSQIVNQNATILLAGWFVLCIALTYTGFWSVGNVAHGAGALVGALLGFTMTRDRRQSLQTWISAAIVCALALTMAVFARPWTAWGREAYLAEWQLGSDAWDAGNFNRAARWWADAERMARRQEKLYGNATDVGDLWLNLSYAHEELGDTQAALEWARAAADRSSEGWYQVALLTHETDPEVSRQALEKAAVNHPPAREWLSGLLSAEGYDALIADDNARALQLLARAVRFDPESAYAAFHYAIALERGGERERAIQYYRAAARLDPSDPDFAAAAERFDDE